MPKTNPQKSLFFFLLLLFVGGRLFSILLVQASPTGYHVPNADPVTINLEPFLDGLDIPVNLANSGVPGDDRLFIVQQAGKILVVNPDGTIRPTPFLDITTRVNMTANRSGLFGLAFHPNYEANGLFYVYYVRQEARDVFVLRLSRFAVTNNPNIANPGSENILLTVTKDHPGHNAGDLHFGPDGYLYFPLGDGNSAVTSGRPQDPTTLLGKMARINVNNNPNEEPADCKGQGSGDYSIPPSNPFAGSPTACDELWASGLRNPWRFSFDRVTGDLFLSDVGEARWDELNFLSSGAAGGKNYGWPCYEANAIFEEEEWSERGCEETTTFTFPVISLGIGVQNDCSIIGGFVYRGSRYPALIGRYLMADFCSGHLRDAVRDGNNWIVTLNPETAPDGVVSFGEGVDGELYVVNRSHGEIYHLTGEEDSATPHPPTNTPTPSITPTHTSTGLPSPTVTPSPTDVDSTPLPTDTPIATIGSSPTSSPLPTPTATLVWTDWNYLPFVQKETSRVIPAQLMISNGGE